MKDKAKLFEKEEAIAYSQCLKSKENNKKEKEVFVLSAQNREWLLNLYLELGHWPIGISKT